MHGAAVPNSGVIVGIQGRYRNVVGCTGNGRIRESRHREMSRGPRVDRDVERHRGVATRVGGCHHIIRCTRKGGGGSCHDTCGGAEIQACG